MEVKYFYQKCKCSTKFSTFDGNSAGSTRLGVEDAAPAPRRRAGTEGFLPVALVDNAVLIKTYLFITQTTTGRALDRILDIATRDKHYLSLHTLRAFITTDILDNLTLRTALRESGWGGVMGDFSRMFTGSADGVCKSGYAGEVGRCVEGRGMVVGV